LAGRGIAGAPRVVKHPITSTRIKVRGAGFPSEPSYTHGRRLASTGVDGTLKIWDARPLDVEAD
jgi:hypothetical protein